VKTAKAAKTNRELQRTACLNRMTELLQDEPYLLAWNIWERAQMRVERAVDAHLRAQQVSVPMPHPPAVYMRICAQAIVRARELAGKAWEAVRALEEADMALEEADVDEA
jgi:hypothetical protein